MTFRTITEQQARAVLKILVRPPFIGARYERNWPVGRAWPTEPNPNEGFPVRVTILNNATTYFGCHGVLVSMPWDFPGPAPAWRTTDEVKFNLEQFLEWYHPIENVVTLASRLLPGR